MAKGARRKGKAKGRPDRAKALALPEKPGFPAALEAARGERGDKDAPTAALARYNRRRLAAAAAREPLDFRAGHRALEDDREAALERLGHARPDAKGGIGNPHRAYDTLATLRRNGTIGAAELEAGRAFEEDFARASLNALHASNPARIPATCVAELSDGMVAGRQRVKRAMAALGGSATPAGSAVWCILGTGQTVKEWAAACQFGQTRGSLDQKVAKGIFVAALGILAAHYGKRRRAGK